MGHQPCDIVGGQVIFFHNFCCGIGHFRYGMFKYELAILKNKMFTVSNRFYGRRIQRSTGFHIQMVASHTIRAQDVIHHTKLFCCRFEQYSCSSITKQRTSLTIRIIGDHGHFLTSDKYHFFISTTFYILSSSNQAKKESGTTCIQIKSESILHSNHIGNNLRISREMHIRCHCSTNQQIYFFRFGSGFLEQIFYGLCTQPGTSFRRIF